MAAITTILGNRPPVFGPVLIGVPKLERPASGWDILKETLWLPHYFWLNKGDVRDGPGPEGGTFIVQDINPVDWKAGRPIVEVISYGCAMQDGKEAKWESNASLGEDLSLANGEGVTGGSATIWRLGYPRVTKLWVSLTPQALGDHVGVHYAPEETFGLPATPWSISWVSADNWNASGWVGESRNPQRLPGCRAELITDTWLYDLGYADRDGVANGVIYL